MNQPLRILLAEDAVSIQVLAVGLLQKKWNHEVTVARNGQEAIALLTVQPFDLVLMDVQMPEMDGLEATRAIRQMEAGGRLPLQPGSHVPIIAMTAHTSDGQRADCLDAGMDGHVTKPIRAEELEAVVSRYADRLVSVTAQEQTMETQGSPPSLVHWSDALKSVQGDRELLRTVVCAFLTECSGHVRKLAAAIEANDAKSAHRQAHLIHGVMATFGIPSVAKTARTLEQQCGAGDMTDSQEIFQKLEPQLAEVTAVLKEFLNGNIAIP
jgi:CheY-like chemotaxis protein/HPt (histidine-containing phosphotransfer) domain-containing protein